MNDQVNPLPFFETILAYQKSAALAGALELDLFSAIAKGASDVPAIAAGIGASERGTRILCDHLAVMGFLEKHDGRYGLAPVSAAFLDRGSPAYVGSVATFLFSDTLRAGFADIAGAVRRGGTLLPEQGTMTPDHGVWVTFARAMAPMAAVSAQALAEGLRARGVPAAGPRRALDVAAGHGLYGIALLAHVPELRVTALDWAAVLEVAKENAAAAGVADRHELRAGSAFDADLGGPYDLVLLPNFLHHFDHAGCVKVLRRMHDALVPGGHVAIVESIPDEDRLSPPFAAVFSLVMLATTERGEAYTMRQLDAMLDESGFTKAEAISLEPSMQQGALARRK